MKNLSSSLFLSIFAILFLIGCSDKKDPEPTTSLNITVTDETGIPVSGAIVRLYKSETDWKQQENEIAKYQTSDKSGNVTFTNLEEANYFWFARHQCTNNYNGVFSTAESLAPNKVTAVTSALTGTGIFEFINSSNITYQILFEDQPYASVVAGSSLKVRYAPLGVYTVKNSIRTQHQTELTCGGTVSSTAFE